MNSNHIIIKLLSAIFTFLIISSETVIAAVPTIGILNPISEFQFVGNLADKHSNSNLVSVSSTNDGTNRCNKTQSFSTDSNGSYWGWNASGCARGGGFHIDVNQNIQDNYTIGVRFRFADVTGTWRKIVDYLNRTLDTGFYIKDNAIKFWLSNSDIKTGISNIQANQVLDLIVTRDNATKKFIVYTVTQSGLTQELSFIDSTDQARPVLVGGQTRLGFFFDDTRTTDEATSSGAVYSIKIWGQPIKAADILGSMNFSDVLSFHETLVNNNPQSLRLGIPVRSDSTDFNGGNLRITYATPTPSLVEDIIGITSTGDGTGEIRFDSVTGHVFYEGTQIGTVPLAGVGSGKQGNELLVSLNNNVTVDPVSREAKALEALFGAINYQNSSNTPTLQRKIAINVTDPIGTSNLLEVTINVVPDNDIPVAHDNVFTVPGGATLNVHAPELLKNDFDADGDILHAINFSTPTTGTLTQPVPSDGSFEYSAPPVFNTPRIATFTYRASDGSAQSSAATVTINLTPTNRSPIGRTDQYSIAQDTVLSMDASHGVLANDSDPDIGNNITAENFTNPANGVLLTTVADGHFVYQPNPGFFGNDSFTYQVTDGTDTTTPITVSIEVRHVNHSPRSNPDSYSVNEDAVLNISAPGLLGNDLDQDGDLLQVNLNSKPACGVFNKLAHGSFSFQPQVGTPCAPGTVTFTYRATDGHLESSDTQVSIDVHAVNHAPVALADNYTVGEDSLLNISLSGSVLANDRDIDGNTMLVVLGTTRVAHGSLQMNLDGQFTYQPASGFFGTDTFSYKASDGRLESNEVIVTITVNHVNHPTLPNNDSYTVAQDGILKVNIANGLLANDLDIDGDVLLVTNIPNSVNHGVLQMSLDGSFSYTPAPGYSGSDSFTYIVNDGTVDSSPVTVSINVSHINRAPLAANDNYSIAEDGKLKVSAGNGILANDLDVDGDQLIVVIENSPANGSLQMNLDGSFTYQPVNLFNGTDSFTYKANDGTTDSATVTVTITVNHVNHPAQANGDNYSTAEDSVLRVTAANGLLTNDLDIDGDTLQVTNIPTSVSHGLLQMQLDGSFTYTPTAGYSGADSFTYTVNDGSVDSGPVMVNLLVNHVNHPPLTSADAYSLPQNSVLSVPAPGLLANDLDIDADPLFVLLQSFPVHGALHQDLDGGFSYRPAPGFEGTDSFTYMANDGTTNSHLVTVTLSVHHANQPPLAQGDSYSTARNTTLQIGAFQGVLNNDIDTEGNLLTPFVVSHPTHGTLQMEQDGSFKYLPNTDYAGLDNFTYKANDGLLDSNLVTVVINVNFTNRAPVAAHDSYSIAQNSILNIPSKGILSNDTDADGDMLFALIQSFPVNGALHQDLDGSLSYYPAPGYQGTDSYTYMATDGKENSNIATVRLNVNPVNHAPLTGADSYSTIQDTSLQINSAQGMLNNDIDIDGDTLISVIVSQPQNGILHALNDGSFTYTPIAGFAGLDNFSYSASDGHLSSITTNVVINVHFTNHSPIATDDNYTIAQDTLLQVNSTNGLLSNDSDPDANTLQSIIVTLPGNGTLHPLSDGGFSYQPSQGYVGTDSFTYKASDSNTESNIANVSIDVHAVNHIPFAGAYDYSVPNPTLQIDAPGLLTTATDQDGNLLTAIVVNQPLHGSLHLNPDGSFTYTPTTGYLGIDGFTYKVNDGHLDSAAAPVTLIVSTMSNTARPIPTLSQWVLILLVLFVSAIAGFKLKEPS